MAYIWAFVQVMKRAIKTVLPKPSVYKSVDHTRYKEASNPLSSPGLNLALQPLGRQVSLQDVHAPFDLQNDLVSLSLLPLKQYSKSSKVFFYQRKMTNKLNKCRVISKELRYFF